MTSLLLALASFVIVVTTIVITFVFIFGKLTNVASDFTVQYSLTEGLTLVTQAGNSLNGSVTFDITSFQPSQSFTIVPVNAYVSGSGATVVVDQLGNINHLTATISNGTMLVTFDSTANTTTPITFSFVVL